MCCYAVSVQLQLLNLFLLSVRKLDQRCPEPPPPSYLNTHNPELALDEKIQDISTFYLFDNYVSLIFILKKLCLNYWIIDI